MLPETLLHYRILHPLGSGGMGEVYLAEDTKLDRRVALKILRHVRTDGADAERRQRFEREAKAVAALNHPNIVTIHSVEQAGEITFLTMELVDGRTLSELIPKGGLPVDRLLKIGIPLADAVAAAHDRGVTHRDLKPANVMLTGDGRVKVLDFGLAKLRETTEVESATKTGFSPQPLTGEGRIVGTVAYMSPEQAEGKLLDPRSDLFSLGVVLYEMATGVRPFTGDTPVSIISSIVKDTPPSLTDLNQSIPRHLARIVKRALVKDPDHRYQTARDLRNDLETLKEELDSGVSEPSIVSTGTSRPVPQPRRVLPIAIAAGAVAIVAGLAWTFWPARGNAPSPDQPFDHIRMTRLTSTGTVSLAALSADGRYLVHVVDVAGKASLWLRQVATSSNVQIVAPEEGARYDGVSFSRDGNYVYYSIYPRNQNFATAFQVPVLGGTPRRVIDDVDSPLESSPDGKQVAFLRGYQTKGEAALIVASADGTGERQLSVHKFPLTFPMTRVVWSPDGRTIVAPLRVDVQTRTKLIAVDAASGKESDLGSRIWASVESQAWMPDGKGLVAIATEDVPGAPSQVWHISYPQGEARRITNDLNNYSQVSVSADASALVAVQGEVTAHIWVAPMADPARVTQVTTGTGRLDGFQSGMSWTPDGRIVFTSNASGNSDIWITDATGANQRQLTLDPATDGNPVATPDGKSIIFSSSRAGASIWQMDIDGGNQRPLIVEPGAMALAVSDDARWLYYTMMSSVPRQSFRMPLGGGAPEPLIASWQALGFTDPGIFYHPNLWIIAVSRDQSTVAGYYSDPERRGFRVGLFPVAGGQPKRLEINIPSVAFTADGKQLIFGEVTNGVANLFRQSIDGGPVTAITSYTSNGLTGFALSRDGKQLALSRGTATSDVVLITQQK